MNEDNEAVALAKLWHKLWRDALLARDFDKAEECFRSANRWRMKADIHGMMSQEFNEVNNGRR